MSAPDLDEHRQKARDWLVDVLEILRGHNIVTVEMPAA
jgi:hypothetical protein